MKAPHCSSLALFAAAVSLASAQMISFTGTSTAENASGEVMAEVGGQSFLAFLEVSAASGTASSISGFPTFSAEPASFSFAFDNLILTGFQSGAPDGVTVQTYTPDSDPVSMFTFSLSGTPIATGQIISLVVETEYTTGSASAHGSVQLSAGGDPNPFFNDINFVTGGTNIVDFTITSFISTTFTDPENYETTGTFTVSAVPEPAALALCFGAVAGAAAWLRRRSHSVLGTRGPVPASGAGDRW